MSKFLIECRPDHAAKLRDWIQNRGGVALWRSIDLSDPGASVLTPADSAKPRWKFANEPEVIVTRGSDVGVYQEVLFRAFHVALRRSTNGLAFKLTDYASERVHKVMNECREKHGNAHYRKGLLGLERPSISVFYVNEQEIKPLSEVQS